MGGSQQPDRGNLSHLAAAANHFFPPTPSLAHQRLRQSGMKRTSSRELVIFCSKGFFFFFENLHVCLSGDGRGWSL